MTSSREVVKWNDGGEEISIPLRWLRFECPCSDCRVEQTSERRWLPVGDDEFSASSVESTAGGVTVHWTSGHITRFDAESLRLSLGTRLRARINVELWGGGGKPQRFSHAEVLEQPAELLRFLTAFRDEGVAVLEGTPSIPGQLEDTMAALELPLREAFNERLHDVKVDPAGYNIAHTNEGLPPHADFPSYSHPPSGQVLHMIMNECTGGDTFVVDGWNAATELGSADPGALRALVEVEVPFRQYSEDRETFARQTMVKLNTAGEVNGFRFSNQLMQPLHATHERFDEWMDAYIALARFVTDTDNHRQFRLNSGDALFVHGHRVLHARTGFTVDGDRHLQDCYFEFDDVLARIDRMSGLADAKVVGG